MRVETEYYQELDKDKKYIIFLAKNTDGNFSIINTNMGKYTLDLADLSDLGRPDNKVARGEKLKLKQSILAKYKDFLVF